MTGLLHQIIHSAATVETERGVGVSLSPTELKQIGLGTDARRSHRNKFIIKTAEIAKTVSTKYSTSICLSTYT